MKRLRPFAGDIRTLPPGLPIFLEGGPEAVLLVHGYTGVPDEFRFLGTKLNDAGYTVSVPRLPGHGTCGADFLATGAEDWYGKIQDEYSDLRARREKVHLAGLSMGALLVLLLASEVRSGKLVLAAPAIINTDRRIALTPFLKYFSPTLARRGYVFDGPEEYRSLAREYWEKTWVAPAAELYKLQKAAKKILPRVTAETLLIVSEKDRTVPLEAADQIEAGIASSRVERLTLKESGHVVVNGSEREAVAEKIISWLKEGS